MKTQPFITFDEFLSRFVTDAFFFCLIFRQRNDLRTRFYFFRTRIEEGGGGEGARTSNTLTRVSCTLQSSAATSYLKLKANLPDPIMLLSRSTCLYPPHFNNCSISSRHLFDQPLLFVFHFHPFPEVRV